MSTETDKQERADLEELIKTPGWLRVTNALNEYWQKELERAADVLDGELATIQLRNVIAARKACQQTLAYPFERLRVLKGSLKPEQPMSMSRGGYDPTPAR